MLQIDFPYHILFSRIFSACFVMNLQQYFLKTVMELGIAWVFIQLLCQQLCYGQQNNWLTRQVNTKAAFKQNSISKHYPHPSDINFYLLFYPDKLCGYGTKRSILAGSNGSKFI